MKLNTHDRIPIGKARCGTFKFRDSPPPPIPEDDPNEDPEKAYRRVRRQKLRAIRQEAARQGLRPTTAAQLFRRHPEMWDWTPEQVCRQLVLNLDQAAVAKRQGTAGGFPIRGRFKPMVYAAPPELEES